MRRPRPHTRVGAPILSETAVSNVVTALTVLGFAALAVAIVVTAVVLNNQINELSGQITVLQTNANFTLFRISNSVTSADDSRMQNLVNCANTTQVFWNVTSIEFPNYYVVYFSVSTAVAYSTPGAAFSFTITDVLPAQFPYPYLGIAISAPAIVAVQDSQSPAIVDYGFDAGIDLTVDCVLGVNLAASPDSVALVPLTTLTWTIQK